MSGETAGAESGWTTDTLKAHFEALRESDQRAITAALASQQEAVRAALSAAEKAVAKAEAASEKRFDSVNEFRGTLADQAATLMPRSESMALHAAAAEKIDAVDKRLDKSEGRRGGVTDSRSLLLTVVPIIIAILVAAFVIYAAIRK